MRFGENLSHWIFKFQNKIYGGMSKNPKYTITEPDNVKWFVENLFVKKIGTIQN